MKHRIALGIALALLFVALVASEKYTFEAPVGPDAILHFIADTERELSRLPVALTRLSDEEEVQIGNELAAGYANGLGAARLEPEAQTIADYVAHVGGLVAVRAQRKLPYRFHYIPDRDFINAFALPGGHVFLGAGLLARMDTEDELAAVLGHEIEHIDHYHCAERLQLEAAKRRLHLGVLGELLSLPVKVFQAGYGKAQELEADREGTLLAVRASYSPWGAVSMFEKFQRLEEELRRPAPRAGSPLEELSRVSLETLQGYFRSHPPPGERAATIRRLIQERQWETLTQQRPLEVASAFRPQPTR